MSNKKQIQKLLSNESTFRGINKNPQPESNNPATELED